VLEDAVQAEHLHVFGAERGGDALRLRDAVLHAARTEHLERLDDDHAAAQAGEAERRGRVQPFAGVELGRGRRGAHRQDATLAR
jgi:hypothetical protein